MLLYVTQICVSFSFLRIVENSRQHDGLGIDYVTAFVFPPLPKPIPEHETVLISRGNARNKACQTYEKYDAVWPEKHMDPTDYFIVSNIKHKKHRRNTLRELSTILKNEKETQTQDGPVIGLFEQHNSKNGTALLFTKKPKKKRANPWIGDVSSQRSTAAS